MAIFEIPLTPDPQVFDIVLGGKTYRIVLSYKNVAEGGWILDISDTSGNPIITGIPLVTGADLLAQYSYLGFGGKLMVQTSVDPDVVPTFENLGIGSHLYWITV